MDIYGYNAYLYGRSDELAKQMYAQQALANCNRPAEPHAMPEPSGAPWSAGAIPWGLPSPPQLVQFTGQALEPQPGPSYASVSHCKRKSLDVEPVVPAKQLITEEKMAAHLSGLHISSEYTGHSLASEELMDVGVDTLATASNKIKGHKVVLSEELKRLNREPLLPAALIERLEKPCMSLVVWKPKESILHEKLEECEEEKTDPKCRDINEEPSKRNGVLVGDLGMDIEM